MPKKISVDSKVKLKASPPYFKTAEPMPMLRPPDTIKIEEKGRVTGLKPGGYWVVKFASGSFLLDSQYIEVIEK